MPRYDYKCDSCSHVQEISHSISETPDLPICYCGEGVYRKVFSATPVQFKGKGFYKTDNT